MTDTTYNGWANWETWNMVLWMDNEEGTYRARRRLPSITAASVKEVCLEFFPNGTPDFDETDGGVEAIDWNEIAESWNEED